MIVCHLSTWCQLWRAEHLITTIRGSLLMKFVIRMEREWQIESIRLSYPFIWFSVRRTEFSLESLVSSDKSNRELWVGRVCRNQARSGEDTDISFWGTCSTAPLFLECTLHCYLTAYCRPTFELYISLLFNKWNTLSLKYDTFLHIIQQNKFSYPQSWMLLTCINNN